MTISPSVLLATACSRGSLLGAEISKVGFTRTDRFGSFARGRTKGRAALIAAGRRATKRPLGLCGLGRYCLTQAILQGRRGTLWMVGKPGANRSRATPRRPCELVKLELADFATRTLREMTLDEV